MINLVKNIAKSHPEFISGGAQFNLVWIPPFKGGAEDQAMGGCLTRQSVKI
jgi:hypothetical protein